MKKKGIVHYPRFITEVRVHDCYVSSTHHHFYIVSMNRPGNIHYGGWDYCWSSGELSCDRVFSWTPPKYLNAMVINAIKKAVSEKSIRYFELDRDGERRYEDLRYHYEEHEQSVIAYQV